MLRVLCTLSIKGLSSIPKYPYHLPYSNNTFLFQNDIFTLGSFNLQQVFSHSLISTRRAGRSSQHEEKDTNTIHACPHKFDDSISMDLGGVEALLVREAASVGDGDVPRVPGNHNQLVIRKVGVSQEVHSHKFLTHLLKHSVASGVRGSSCMKVIKNSPH